MRPKGSRHGTLAGREEDIAAGQRQPIRLSDNRCADDLNRDVQVGHHSLNAGELLRVLLAKDGDLRPDDVEQLQDDGEHSVEVAGPGVSLEH